MPFDGPGTTPAIRRAMLAERLRNDTEWEWNFCNTAGCAIGMAATMFKGQYRSSNLCEFLGLTGKQYASVFGYISVVGNKMAGWPAEWSPFYGMVRESVTPAMVADALERIE